MDRTRNDAVRNIFVSSTNLWSNKQSVVLLCELMHDISLKCLWKQSFFQMSLQVFFARQGSHTSLVILIIQVIGKCYGLSPPSPHPIHIFEALTPNVTVFGDWTFRDVKLNEIIMDQGRQIQKGWCPYKKRYQISLSLPQLPLSPLSTSTQKDHVETERRQLFISQQKRFHQELNWLSPRYGTSSLQNCQKINFCFGSPTWHFVMGAHTD